MSDERIGALVTGELATYRGARPAFDSKGRQVMVVLEWEFRDPVSVTTEFGEPLSTEAAGDSQGGSVEEADTGLPVLQPVADAGYYENARWLKVFVVPDESRVHFVIPAESNVRLSDCEIP